MALAIHPQRKPAKLLPLFNECIARDENHDFDLSSGECVRKPADGIFYAAGADNTLELPVTRQTLRIISCRGFPI